LIDPILNPFYNLYGGLYNGFDLYGPRIMPFAPVPVLLGS
jgi:hypothetical protein